MTKECIQGIQDPNRERQIELEKQFSSVEFNKYLDENLADTLEQVYNADVLFKLSKAINIKDIMLLKDTLKEIIMILGNPNNGLVRNNGDRSFKVSHLVSLFSSLKYLENDNIDLTYLYAFQIIEQLDGILFEVTEFISRIDESEDDIYIIVDWEIGEDSLIYEGLTRYKLPMLSKPNNWKPTKAGGYYDSTDKVTLKKGEAEQPKEALQFINKMQSQKFKLVNYDLDEFEEYLFDKFEKKGLDLYESKEAIQNIMLTFKETCEYMKDEEFFLTWKYDFRLRAYSQGYDLNIQGDSYRKGMLKPLFEYPKADKTLLKYEGK